MLRCDNLVKRYMFTTAIDDLSLRIEPGKIYALLGPNGSGKSTLMKMLVGIAKPAAGNIMMDNHDISYKTKADIAYMPTEAYFFPYMNCIDIGNYYQDFFEDFDMSKYLKLLEDMQLNPKQKVKSMSTGMMAKLKIAVNLARKAKVLLLDEPLNGIDIIARDKIIQAIINNIDEETAVVISSHLVDELEKIVDHVIFIKDGKCVREGNADALREGTGKSIVEMYKEIYA